MGNYTRVNLAASLLILNNDCDSPEVDSLVVAELSVGHVSMITDDLPHVLRRHVLFLGLDKSKLSLLTVTL